MNHALLILQPPAGDEGGSGSRNAMGSLPHIHANDQIRNPGFVFDRNGGNALRCPRPLAHQHWPANADVAAIKQTCQMAGGNNAQPIKLLAEVRAGLSFKRQPGS